MDRSDGAGGDPIRPTRAAPLRRPGVRPRGQRRARRRRRGDAGDGDAADPAPAAAPGGPREAPLLRSQESERWVMPWERQPSWLYLPHLLPLHADVGASGDARPGTETIQLDDGGLRNRREQHGGAHGLEGRDNGQAPPTSRDCQDDEWMPRQGTPRGERASHDTIERSPRRSSGVVRCTIAVEYARAGASAAVGRVGAILASEAAGDTATARVGDERVHAIRGRDLPLGPNPDDRGYGAGGDAPLGVTAASARAFVRRQEAGGDVARGRAKARLDAANSHLKISLDDHAERVSRRRERQRSPECKPSAADRLAALRRRVAARAVEQRSDGAEGKQPPHGGAGAGSQCSTATIEVGKIHWDPGGGGGGCAHAGGPVEATAVGATATAAAWHDRGQASAVDSNLGRGG